MASWGEILDEMDFQGESIIVYPRTKNESVLHLK
nr:MAG TPA: hypothetical protein [Caudoviricetes sp.]